MAAGSSPAGRASADVVELADTYGLGPYAARLESSTLSVRTKFAEGVAKHDEEKEEMDKTEADYTCEEYNTRAHT